MRRCPESRNPSKELEPRRRRSLARRVTGVGALTLALALALASAPPLVAAGWLAATWDGTLYDFDPVTGARTNPRPTGIEDLIDISYGPDGQLYGMTAYTGQVNGVFAPDALVRIDPESGASTVVGGGVTNAIIEGDLAYDEDSGLLLGAPDVQPADSGGQRLLFSIDPVLGTTATVGEIVGAIDLGAMAFVDGALYAVETVSDSVLVIDPASGAITDSFATASFANATAAMDYDPESGELLTLDDDGKFRRIDPVSRSTALVNQLDTLAWSGLTRVIVLPIFADDFESGDTSAWMP